jgi:hypothetical protein
MKIKQLLICGALVALFITYGCTTLTTLGDKALGYGPTDGVSAGVMIGAAVLTDGIIYLYDNSDKLVGILPIEHESQTITCNPCHPLDK